MRTRSALVLGLLTVACGVSAEVRVRPGAVAQPPVLEVDAHGPRIWQPNGATTPQTLNPSGDQHADSWPGSAADLDTLLAAWSRGTDGTLHLALSGGDGAIASLVAPGTTSASGTPVVVAVQGGYAVIWQEWQADVGVVGLAAVSKYTGQVSDVVRHPGVLRIAQRMSDSVLVLTQDRTGTLVSMTVFRFNPEPIPLPPEARWSVALMATAPGANQNLVPLKTGLAPIPLCLEGSADAEVLRWRSGNGWVGHIDFDADGPHGAPTYRHGNVGNCRE